ncbi:MAG TPA: hypothetical protein DHO02_03530 [Syntrophaceae bacterium]|nr:hypothetical protein [Syntrophaceae bacterium]HCX01474.1 hypothetical protein [Syntrophaceae bacterium]
MKKRRLLLLTGNGKGKTTAAFGIVLRAAGHGIKCLVIQFVKDDPADAGECRAGRKIQGVQIVQSGKGFVPAPDSPEFAGHRLAAKAGLAMAGKALSMRACDLLVLDEICVALSKGLLEESDVIDLIESPEADIPIILTGRNAPPSLIALADTVTEMREVKHGFALGIKAQKGIEY